MLLNAQIYRNDFAYCLDLILDKLDKLTVLSYYSVIVKESLWSCIYQSRKLGHLQ